MTDALRESDLDVTTTGAAVEDVTDMMEVPGISDLGQKLPSDPGTPFHRLLEARGLSSEDAVGLVIDDDDGVLAGTPDLLQFAFDVKVATAINGKKGLELLSKNLGNVCFVLSDTNMPRMDGPEMLRTARERELLSGVPILIATSNMDQKNSDDINALLKDGIVHRFCLKPFDKPNELADSINAACLQILDEMEREAAEKALPLECVGTVIKADGVDEKALGQEEAPVVA